MRTARHPSTPTDTLTFLAGDPDSGVRYHVAGNPTTPADTLTQLAADTDPYVRRRVAANPTTPTDTLTFLAGDPDPDVRWRVAGNPTTPTQVVRALASDPDPSVSHAATTIGRTHCLHRYTTTLTEPERAQALLLIEAGFPGWDTDLAAVVDTPRAMTVTPAARPSQHR